MNTHPAKISISLCMIVRDCEATITRALSSIIDHVSEAVIVDTGSVDRTREIVRSVVPASKLRLHLFNETTHPASFIMDAPGSWPEPIPEPFTGTMMLADFGAARQYGWEKATGDYILWMDSDDSFVNPSALPDIAADMAARGTDVACLLYEYDVDDRGEIIQEFIRERIARRGCSSRWLFPVHEVFYPGGFGPIYQQAKIRHHRRVDNLPPLYHQRNLKILLHWLRKEADAGLRNPRLLFYLAREEADLWPEKSIEHLRAYLRVACWDEERALAHIIIGKLHEKASRFEEAFTEYAAAHAEFPANPDGLLGCSRIVYHKREWEKCVNLIRLAFDRSRQENVIPRHFVDVLPRIVGAAIFSSSSLVNLGRHEEAIKEAEKGLALDERNIHLLHNLKAAKHNIAILGKIREKENQPRSQPRSTVSPLRALSPPVSPSSAPPALSSLAPSSAPPALSSLTPRSTDTPELAAARQQYREMVDRLNKGGKMENGVQ